MNFYDYIYDSFKGIPFEGLSETKNSFSTVIHNKQILVNQFFIFGLHPEDTEPFNELCLLESSLQHLNSCNIPNNFLDNSLFSLSIGNKFKRSNENPRYGKVFFDNDCIYFGNNKMTLYFSDHTTTEFDIPTTKEDWFNITILEPNFKIDYEDLITVLKMVEMMPCDSSFELYTDSWEYKKDVDK